eukprot:gb/GEZN01009197.1/.p1 GENE.gb/GEZN01009197.1/~~gb/GEZN01009197.1/.p1  ORF type:complete len:256 (-),score=35.20 gb/GEZN01009197.1/:535-1302(-)
MTCGGLQVFGRRRLVLCGFHLRAPTGCLNSTLTAATASMAGNTLTATASNRTFTDSSLRDRPQNPRFMPSEQDARQEYQPARITPRRVLKKRDRSQAAESARAAELVKQGPRKTYGKTTVEGTEADFISVNHVCLKESVLLLPHLTLCWRPKNWSEITKASLALLEFMDPRPDLILLGTGLETRPLPEVELWLRSLGIMSETMDTPNAAALFQELGNEELRLVGAALVVDPSEEEEELSETDLLKLVNSPGRRFE